MCKGVWLFASGVAVISLLVGLVVWYGEDEGSFREKKETNGTEGPLRLRWESKRSDPRHMTDKLEELDIPVVLTRTPFNLLSRDDWTFESLSQSLKHTLLPFKSSSNPTFKYHAQDQPLSDVPEFHVPQGYRNEILPGDRLLNRVSAEDNELPPTFLYVSGGVELLKSPRPLLQIDLDELTFSPHEGSGQVNFWIGMGGVTAHTHYDTSHNLHALLTGRKRFLIYPPSSYRQLHLYPCLHPLYRQTQVDILNSSVPILAPMVVELEPGQVLYLPPYWFHCVVTRVPSVSLNVWSDSHSYLLMERILMAPIPFESSWSKEVLLAGVKSFMDSLVKKLDFEDSFVRDHVLVRYVSLLGNVSNDRLKLLHPAVDVYCSFSSLPSDEELQRIEARAATTAEIFFQIRPRAVREINLGNYVEHILYTVLRQDDLLMLPLLLQCL